MRRVVVMCLFVLAHVGVVFAQESVRVTIEVRSEEGPARDAEVVVNGVTQRTDAKGITVFTLPPGHVEIVVVKNGFAPASASVDLVARQDQPVTLELTRAASVEEHVTVSARTALLLATMRSRGAWSCPSRVNTGRRDPASRASRTLPLSQL